MDSAKLRADAKAAATQVVDLLKMADFYKPGCCLWAAISGVRVLRSMGWTNATIQAGTVSYRRIPEDDAERLGQLESTAFGYKWGPDHPHSQKLMRQGMMPEFHAWVGVPTATPTKGGVSHEGAIIDFASHLFPEAFEMNDMGYKWAMPRPALPVVLIGEQEPEANLTDYFYEPCAEACLFANASGQNMLVKAALGGNYNVASLLWEVFEPDGRNAMLSAKSVAMAHQLTPFHFLEGVRAIIPKHFPGLKDEQLYGRRENNTAYFIDNKHATRA